MDRNTRSSIGMRAAMDPDLAVVPFKNMQDLHDFFADIKLVHKLAILIVTHCPVDKNYFDNVIEVMFDVKLCAHLTWNVSRK